MAGVESPTIKAAWQFAVQAFEDSAGVHHRTAASYAELIPSLSTVDKNLRALKKELHDHQTNGMKEIDSAQSWIQKLSQKMTKLRYELSEQKRKLASMPPKEGSTAPLSKGIPLDYLTLLYRKNAVSLSLQPSPILSYYRHPSLTRSCAYLTDIVL